jgi:hypothetical protein
MDKEDDTEFGKFLASTAEVLASPLGQAATKYSQRVIDLVAEAVSHGDPHNDLQGDLEIARAEFLDECLQPRVRHPKRAERNTVSDHLLFPKQKWSRSEVLGPSRPVPKESGVYAWYFREIPPSVPVTGCHRSDDLTLLYVGISPKKQAEGGKASQQTLRARLHQHFNGNAACSTLRLSLGCLLGLDLKQIGPKRFTFGPDGEAVLSDWMGKNAFVCWVPSHDPWIVEDKFLATHGATLPLNVKGNSANPFRDALKSLRRRGRDAAS